MEGLLSTQTRVSAPLRGCVLCGFFCTITYSNDLTDLGGMFLWSLYSILKCKLIGGAVEVGAALHESEFSFRVIEIHFPLILPSL